MPKKEKDTLVVLTHRYQRSKQHKDKWEVHETCDVVDRVKTNMYTSATCIVNITQKKVEKNRAGGKGDADYDNLIKYLLDTYPDQFKQIGFNG